MKTIVINKDFMGIGSEELGRKLMASFFRKVWSLEDKPDKIIFFNAGVKLVVEGSNCLESLQELGKAGVDILACGTCINYFDLKEKLKVGRVSNMEEIASTMLQSDSVITV